MMSMLAMLLGSGMAMDLVAGDCSCKYQGSKLPESLYKNYPASDPGKYENHSSIRSYGTMCAAWDQVPSTPWVSYCPSGSNWSDPTLNWCQIPWCYVDESCESKVASSVFTGSSTAFYSYATCGNSPDCYSNGPDGAYGAGTTGCPYDPHGESTNMVYKSECACLYQGSALPADLYNNYPTSDPGKYNTSAQIELYGTACAAWDQSPDTPWYSYCPKGADWCSYDYNWCQAPWCYVNSSCSTKVASSVFKGSQTAFYSYNTCLSTPDCYTNSGKDNRKDLPKACPFDSSDNSWSTAKNCSSGWTSSSPSPPPSNSTSTTPPPTTGKSSTDTAGHRALTGGLAVVASMAVFASTW